jgi:PAS domain S-box-containing protein
VVSVIADDIVVIAVFFVAALVICLQWLASGRLRSRVDAAERAMVEVRGLLDQAPLGLAILDRELRYVYLNKLLADINGADADAHLGKSLHDMVPDISSDAEERFLDVVRTGRPLLGLLLRGSTAAQPGVARVWRENVYPRHDRRGRVVGVAVAVEEITEQKRLTEELRTSELLERRRTSELESVMDAVPAAVFIAHDRACKHVSVNPEGARLLRLRQGESPSLSAPGARPFEVRANGAPVPLETLPLQRAAARGEEVRDEEFSIHFDGGDVISVVMNAVPLVDEDGMIVGAVAAFVDTTASMTLAQGLRQEAARKDRMMAELLEALRVPLADLGAGLGKLAQGSAGQAGPDCAAIAQQVAHALSCVDDMLDRDVPKPTVAAR